MEGHDLISCRYMYCTYYNMFKLEVLKSEGTSVLMIRTENCQDICFSFVSSMNSHTDNV